MAIVFIHSGYSPYLEFSLRQARAADPEAEIILLGDDRNDRFPFLEHVDATAAPYRAAVEPLDAAYVHLSTNRRAFEIICFQRWFLLRALMRARGLEDVLVLDSDVMLYASEEELRQTWLYGKSLGVDRPVEQAAYRWLTSAGVSYWTAERVEAFCTFILRAYEDPAIRPRYDEKWRHHLERGLPGGICDMTALHLFVDACDPSEVANFSEVRDGVTCDQNATDAENLWPGEYRMAGGVKAMEWDDEGRPYGYNLRLGRPVRFQALHFAGKSKALMTEHYRGPWFPAQSRVRRQLAQHYAMRRVASAVLQPMRLVASRLGLRR